MDREEVRKDIINMYYAWRSAMYRAEYDDIEGILAKYDIVIDSDGYVEGEED